jgi:type I restriction enzyme S subunit
LPEYVRALVGSWYGKGYFLKVAKLTTGIASINKTQLSGFPVLLPSLALQQAFAERCSDARSLIIQQERHLAQADALLQSLMARYRRTTH